MLKPKRADRWYKEDMAETVVGHSTRMFLRQFGGQCAYGHEHRNMVCLTHHVRYV